MPFLRHRGCREWRCPLVSVPSHVAGRQNWTVRHLQVGEQLLRKRSQRCWRKRPLNEVVRLKVIAVCDELRARVAGHVDRDRLPAEEFQQRQQLSTVRFRMGCPSSTRNRPNATSTRSNAIRPLWRSASCAAFPALSQRRNCTPSRSSVRVHITPIIGSSSTTRTSGGRLSVFDIQTILSFEQWSFQTE
jgi:hypothetical protein